MNQKVEEGNGTHAEGTGKNSQIPGCRDVVVGPQRPDAHSLSQCLPPLCHECYPPLWLPVSWYIFTQGPAPANHQNYNPDMPGGNLE